MSRMTASSSQLSHSRRATSTASEASSNRSTPRMSRRPNSSDSCGGAADAHLPAGSAVRDEVKGGNGFRNVERLGVGHGGDGDQTDVVRHRCHSRGHQNRVWTARKPTRLDLGAAAPLGGERVVEGHEVEQPAFGGDGEPGPVPATRHGFAVGRVPPCLGVPAVAVERDRNMDVVGHDERLLKREGIDLALGGQRLGQPEVSRRQVQRLGLRLAITGRQIHAPVAAGGDLGLELARVAPWRGPDDGIGCRSRCA